MRETNRNHRISILAGALIQRMKEQNVCQKSRTALLLVDVINHFEFPDGARTLRHAMGTVSELAKLKARARRAGVATIYVNDNFGQWRSDVAKLLKYCLRPEAAGREFVQAVLPDDQDYFVLKPMHSAFYQTPLDALLRALNTSSLILCGLATNSCIVCSAHDARMRELAVTVASDCCAARSLREHNQALDHIRNMTGSAVQRSRNIRLDRLKG
jgi:nicotinamidase-related amidase